MKLLFRLVVNISGYGFVLNQLTVLSWESISQKKKNMIVAEKFIKSLVSTYGKHTVYTDGGTWYDEACTIIGLKHYLHTPFHKSIMERVNQYLKDRTESFDDYYPCRQQKENECSLFHVYNWIQFFVSMYNYTITNNNNNFGLKEVRILS